MTNKTPSNIKAAIKKLSTNWYSEGSPEQVGLEEDVTTLLEAYKKELFGKIDEMYNPSESVIYNRERHGEPNVVVFLDQLKELIEDKL